MPAWLTLREHRAPGGAIHLLLCGELDLSTIAPVRDRLAALLADRGDVVVDLQELTFLDSSGLRTLLTASQEAARQGCTVQLTRATPPVMRVFDLAGLTEYLPFLAEAPATRADGRNLRPA